MMVLIMMMTIVATSSVSSRRRRNSPGADAASSSGDATGMSHDAAAAHGTNAANARGKDRGIGSRPSVSIVGFSALEEEGAFQR